MYDFKTEPLENRLFDLGTDDCLRVVIGFYELNFGITIPDYSRPKDWDPSKDNLIENLYAHAGFDKLDVDEHWPPRPADLLATTVGGTVPNHLIIYLGNNEILHHKVGMLSCRESFRPAWRRYASYILRHPDIPDLTKSPKTATLQQVYDEKVI